MKLLKRKKKSVEPERRRVAGVGRTTAYAYHARRSEEDATLGRRMFRDALEKRVKKKQNRQFKQRFVAVLVLLAALAGLIYMLGLSTDPQVLPVDDTQVPLLHPLADYQKAARKAMNSSIFNRNKITVNTGAISSALKRQFPELSIASVNLPVFGRQPTIYLASADPVLALTTLDSHTYIIDATGRAIGFATPAETSRLHLVPTKDMSGTPVKLGQRVLAADGMAFIQTILYQMQQKHVVVTSLTLPAASSEADLYIDGAHYYGKFNLASDTAREQAGTFLATKHYLEGKGLSPQEYIDVRVDGRAYYK
jgi:hypothetical protein